MSAGAKDDRFDRAGHLRKDVDFLQAELRAQQTLLVPVWRELTLIDEQRLALLPLAEAAALLDHDGELVWLGRLGERSVFALDTSTLPDLLAHPAVRRGKLEDLRFAGAMLPAEHAMLAAYARGILHWHGRQRHCGVCGAPTAAREGGHVRVCRNEACATQNFPRTDPAVIMLVQDGDRCLLGRQARWPAGMYSTLAGFVEPGETIEEAVAREIHEEAGVTVTDVRYFRSQPWPYPASLMIGFFATATSTQIHVGADELQDAQWFTREQVRSAQARTSADGIFVPGRFSLAGQLIEAFLSCADTGENTGENTGADSSADSVPASDRDTGR